MTMRASLPGWPRGRSRKGVALSEVAALTWPDPRWAGTADEAADRANTRRAGRALITAAFFTKLGGGYADPAVDVIGDLLGDLMHAADALGAEFPELLGRAQRRYEEELDG